MLDSFETDALVVAVVLATLEELVEVGVEVDFWQPPLQLVTVIVEVVEVVTTRMDEALYIVDVIGHTVVVVYVVMVSVSTSEFHGKAAAAPKRAAARMGHEARIVKWDRG